MTQPVPFGDLLAEVERIVAEAADRDSALQAICDLLEQRVEHYDWVGFYIADNATSTLALGPFAGSPTEHVRIAFGQGVCGQAAERREPFVVQDVSKESNYLSCSADVRSEVVLPIVRGGELLGEIDIDSHALSPFTDADRAFLERVAGLVSGLF
jgi:GAF domain-containing protein